jgi:hypothetical protein
MRSAASTKSRAARAFRRGNNQGGHRPPPGTIATTGSCTVVIQDVTHVDKEATMPPEEAGEHGVSDDQLAKLLMEQVEALRR